MASGCSWVRTHDGDDEGVAQHGGHNPNNRLTETYSKVTKLKSKFYLFLSWLNRALNNPGLKVNQIITLYSIQMYFAALFCVHRDY